MKCTHCGGETYASLGGREVCGSCGRAADSVHDERQMTEEEWAMQYHQERVDGDPSTPRPEQKRPDMDSRLSRDDVSIGIPFQFTGTGRVGPRLFRGKAEFKKANGQPIVSGSALRGNSMAFEGLYWVCALVTALGVAVLLFVLAWAAEFLSMPVTFENFLKDPMMVFLGAVIPILCIAGGIYAASLLCKFVLRERAVAELPRDSLAAVVGGHAYAQRQDDDKPPVQMRHVTIRMKDSAPAITIICRQSDVSRLSSLLRVPVETDA